MVKNNNKFSLEKVPLSGLQCDILQILVEEGYPFNQRELAKRTGVGISAVSKALNGLEQFGLVVSFNQSVKSYLLNPYRKDEIKTFLTRYNFGKNKPLILSGHAFVYEAQINDLPDKLANKLDKDPAFLAYYPKNWKHAYHKPLIDGSYKFHKTAKGSKLIAYFKTFGSNAAIIEHLNNEKFLNLKRGVEEIYPGLKIGSSECIATCPWQEYAIQKDPVAVAAIALGIKHKKIEESYGYAEWEEKGHMQEKKLKK